MRHTKSVIGGLALMAVVAGVAMGMGRGGEDKSEKVTLGAVPAAVKATIEKSVGTGAVTAVMKETEEGKTVYEAEFKMGEVEHSVTVSDAGVVLEEETEIKESDLPAAVTAAVKAKYTSGKVGDVSLVKADGKTFYEIGVEVGKEDHELKIEADGKVISDKIEEEKDEKDEKSEKK